MGEFKEILAKIQEGQDLDHTMTFSQREFSTRGKGDLPQRVTSARYGDNPLSDDVELDEADDKALMMLNAMLNKAGITDDEIKAGVSLSRVGVGKVARRLGVNHEHVPFLLDQLRTSLDDQDPGPNAIQEDGSNDRLSYEKDFLNNVTVRDSVTGKEAYIQGSSASALLSQLAAHPENEQSLLSGYQDIMEADEGADGYEDEIQGGTSTYNMPWRLNGDRGTMTVMYGDRGGKPVLKIVDMRDGDGDEMSIHDSDRDQLMVQARAFIDKA